MGGSSGSITIKTTKTSKNMIFPDPKKVFFPGRILVINEDYYLVGNGLLVSNKQVLSIQEFGEDLTANSNKYKVNYVSKNRAPIHENEIGAIQFDHNDRSQVLWKRDLILIDLEDFSIGGANYINGNPDTGTAQYVQDQYDQCVRASKEYYLEEGLVLDNGEALVQIEDINFANGRYYFTTKPLST
jgi:hypothetical protein